MFDRVDTVVRAGAGGSGVVSFRREKFVPFGGPDGGDGGDGGDVIIRADPGVDSLRAFRRKRLYRAANGKNGMSKRKHGRRGDDLVLTVPVGTVVSVETQVGNDIPLADLEQPGEQAVVARGGRGGWGNNHFTSSTNQAPQIAQKGEPGEECSVILEMRLIADVGIIGYPNAGKSTLLSAASAARPKIASYPFTTREPVLGVVEVGQRSFVLAEIPGLIDDAHLGRGLGHDFLRHILRTRVLIHLVDGSALSPVESTMRVNAELGLFDSALVQKPQLIAVNKIDLPQVRGRLDEIKGDFLGAGITPRIVSAATGEGVVGLMAATMELLQSVAVAAETSRRVPMKVFRPRPKSDPRVYKDGDAFVLVSPELERIMAVIDMTRPGVRGQLKGHLTRTGIGKALDRAGVKPGDKIRYGNIEWEW